MRDRLRGRERERERKKQESEREPRHQMYKYTNHHYLKQSFLVAQTNTENTNIYIVHMHKHPNNQQVRAYVPSRLDTKWLSLSSCRPRCVPCSPPQPCSARCMCFQDPRQRCDRFQTRCLTPRQSKRLRRFQNSPKSP